MPTDLLTAYNKIPTIPTYVKKNKEYLFTSLTMQGSLNEQIL